METLILVGVFFLSIVIHEVSHGAAAYWLGDDTAKRAGRLTLNPLRHIDWFYTVILPFTLFVSTQGRFAIGMAKPVPVNFGALRNLRRDMPLVALAGPLSNFIICLILTALRPAVPSALLLYAIYFNLGIAFFNLLPVPPLDGSKIVAAFLPWKWLTLFFRLERYGFLVVLALYFSGILMRIILPLVEWSCLLLGVPGPYQVLGGG